MSKLNHLISTLDSHNASSDKGKVFKFLGGKWNTSPVKKFVKSFKSSDSLSVQVVKSSAGGMVLMFKWKNGYANIPDIEATKVLRNGGCLGVADTFTPSSPKVEFEIPANKLKKLLTIARDTGLSQDQVICDALDTYFEVYIPKSKR